MNISLGEIVNAYGSLQELGVQKTSPKISYWIMKNIKELESHFNYFMTERDKVYREYLCLNEDNEYCSTVNGKLSFNYKNDSVINDFQNEMNELFAFVCDISIFYLQKELLLNSKLQMSASDINNVEFLLTDE